MSGEKHFLGWAAGLAAGVNLLLFVLVAWALAVGQGLRRQVNLLPVTSSELVSPGAETVTLVLSPVDTPEPEPNSRSKSYLQAPPDANPDEPPIRETRFVSSRDMRAASEEQASPDGVPGLISQQGIDKPFLDLRDVEFQDGSTPSAPAESSNEAPDTPDEATVEQMPAESLVKDTVPTSQAAIGGGSPDRPKSKNSEEEPANSAAPEQSVRASSPEELAFASPSSPQLIPLPETSRPPDPSGAAAPDPPKPAVRPRRPPAKNQATPEYTAGMKKGRLKGTISDRGKASLDAKATAEGRFGDAIRGAIEKNWRRSMLKLAGFANPGLVEVDFEVDQKGRVSNVKLANPGEANPVMQDCALSAVIEAKLPPPPQELLEDLQDALTGGRMRCSFTFLIY